jgi:hypothetical protein
MALLDAGGSYQRPMRELSGLHVLYGSRLYYALRELTQYAPRRDARFVAVASATAIVINLIRRRASVKASGATAE